MSFLDSYIFTGDKNKGFLTADELKNRRAMALALAARQRPYPKTVGEGLTALGEGLYERSLNQDLTSQEVAQRARDRSALDELTGGALGGAAAPAPAPVAPGAEPAPTAAPAGPQPANIAPQPQPQRQPAPPNMATLPGVQALASIAPGSQEVQAPRPQPPMGAPPSQMPVDAQQQASMSPEEIVQRLKRVETGGMKNPYQAQGILSRTGQRPNGAYQVMDENVPKWSQEHTGTAMTPEQFRNDPEAQDAIALGQVKKYLTQFGGDPNKVAAAWFAGPGYEKNLNVKDGLGTSIAEYQRRFNRPLPNQEIASSLAAQPTQSTSPTAGAEEDARLADVTGVSQQQPRVQLASVARDQPVSDASPDSAVGEGIANSVAARRAEIAGAVERQQTQAPQRVAQAAPAPPLPEQPQQNVSKAPQTPIYQGDPNARPPAPGPRPVAPDPRADPQLNALMRRAADPYLSDDTRAAFKLQYQELWKQKQTEYTNALALHEKRIEENAKYEIERPKQLLERQKAQQELDKPNVHVVEGRIMQFNNETKKWEDVTPGGNLGPLTEAQSKDLRYYQRGKWALHNLGDGKELTDFAQWYAAGMPVIGNYAANARMQRQLQAAKDFSAIQLRVETGAAAPPAELMDVNMRYIPRPGDSPEVLLQKQQARENIVKGLGDGLGSKAAPHVEKFDREFEVDKKVFDRKMNEVTIQNAPPVRITNPEQLNELQSGQRFVTPDGKIKRKP